LKILLVNPPRFNGRPVGREDRCENTIPNVLTPTGLVILAGILEAKHDIRLIDANGLDIGYENIRKQMQNFAPDVVVFKATPETFGSDIQTATVAKAVNTNTKTVMICWSLTRAPERVLQRATQVDCYILDHHYERPIEEIADGADLSQVHGICYRDGNEIVVRPSNEMDFDFSKIPMPAWHLIDQFEPYWVQVPSIRPCVTIESAKGCGMTCSFCTIANIRPCFRNIENVVEEINYLYFSRGVRYLSLFDATFNINRRRAIEFCDAINREGMDKLRWYANIRADRMDQELANAMRNAGCRGVSMGVESGSQAILDMAGKRLRVDEAKEAIAILKKSRIKQYASFIVGLPGETLDTMNATKSFILESKPTGFQVNSLVPYPGTKICDLAIERGIISEDMPFENLLLFDTPVTLCDLSAQEINDFRRKIYREVYRHPGWWLSNLLFVARNPEDYPVGFDYGIKILKRLSKGVDYET
jgi:tRNA A37 methylthiotransferase MiaB